MPPCRLTQASQTPSWVGTVPSLGLFLERAPGLGTEGRGRGASWGRRRMTSSSARLGWELSPQALQLTTRKESEHWVGVGSAGRGAGPRLRP